MDRDADGGRPRGDALTRRALIGSGTALLGAGTSLALGLATGAPARDALPAAALPGGDPRAMLDSGRLWSLYCRQLEQLGKHVLEHTRPGQTLQRAEGLRCLGRLASLGLDRLLEHADTTRPTFLDLQTATRKYMGDNPDQTYRVASISGAHAYRVSGEARDTAGVEIGVYAGSFSSDASSGGRRLVGKLDETELDIDADGRFEITLAPGAAGPNTIALAPDAIHVLIRTYFWDLDARTRHPMPAIERTDADPGPATLDPEALMRGLIGSVAFVDGSLAWWNRYVAGLREREPNRLYPMRDDGDIQTPRGVRYLEGLWRLTPEQVLLVEFDPGDTTAYWNFLIYNLWGETPDWRQRPVSRNARQVPRGPDGQVRIALAARDPGLPGWIDTSGLDEGPMSLRWRDPAPLPKATTRVVALDEFWG